VCCEHNVYLDSAKSASVHRPSPGVHEEADHKVRPGRRVGIAAAVAAQAAAGVRHVVDRDANEATAPVGPVAGPVAAQVDRLCPEHWQTTRRRRRRQGRLTVAAQTSHFAAHKLKVFGGGSQSPHHTVSAAVVLLCRTEDHGSQINAAAAAAAEQTDACCCQCGLDCQHWHNL
jgi:hypothetical protein